MVINNKGIKVIGQFPHLPNISRMIHDFEYFIFLFGNYSQNAFKTSIYIISKIHLFSFILRQIKS
jgi:hypothetical protein